MSYPFGAIEASRALRPQGAVPRTVNGNGLALGLPSLSHRANVRGWTMVIRSLMADPRRTPSLISFARSAGVTLIRLGSLLRRIRFSPAHVAKPSHLLGFSGEDQRAPSRLRAVSLNMPAIACLSLA